MTRHLDTSVFREPIPAEELTPQPLTGVAALRTASTPVLAGLSAACLLVWLVCSMGMAAAAVDSFTLEVPAVNIGSGIFLAGVLAAAAGFVLQGRQPDPRIAAARLRRFVDHNGLLHQADPKLPTIGGIIFEEGHHQRCSERFRNGPGHAFPFEIAHFSYQTGSRNQHRERNQPASVTTWTYATLTADRPLPHLLLDAKNGDPWFGSSVPASLATSQQVPLPADLNRDFALFAPEGQEAAAVAVFTPEVLRRVLEEAPGFDVETVDNQILFFTREKLDLSSGETWERLSRVIFGPGAALVALANGPVSAQRFADDAFLESSADRGSGASAGFPAGGRRLRRRILTPALLWSVAGLAVLVLAQVLLTGPLHGLI